MKYFYGFFSFIIVAALFTGCAGNKNLQEKAPAQFQQAYFTTDGNFTKFYLPVTAIQKERIDLDSVFFKGKKAVLQQDKDNSMLYVATFQSGKPDLIMSSDPREEYENKAPRINETSPFKLKDSEAVLVFTENGEEKYYRITGIEERSPQ